MFALATKAIAMPDIKMTPNRFGRWAKARKLVAAIDAALAADKEVWVSTHTRHTKYTKKHAGMFVAKRSGAYVQTGKTWACIDFCTITIR